MQIDYLQIGKGRLGRLIAAQVEKQINASIQWGRLSHEDGIQLGQSKNTNITINKLVICISPTENSNWNWNNIFYGLKKQHQLGKIEINQLVLVSSTRVYDGIDKGLIDAATPPTPISEKAKALFTAEQEAMSIAKYHHIIRATGLYGQGYSKYKKILTTSSNHEKFRFGVDISQVAKEVSELLFQLHCQNSMSLLTDNYAYQNGEVFSYEQAEKYSHSKRILKNSRFYY